MPRLITPFTIGSHFSLELSCCFLWFNKIIIEWRGSAGLRPQSAEMPTTEWLFYILHNLRILRIWLWRVNWLAGLASARARERPMTINGRSYGRMKSASARVHCYDSYKYISINHRGDVVCVCMQHLGAGDSGDDLVASLLFAIHNSIRAPTILVWHCHRLSFHCLKLKLSTPQVAYEFHLFRTVKG